MSEEFFDATGSQIVLYSGMGPMCILKQDVELWWFRRCDEDSGIPDNGIIPQTLMVNNW